MSASTFTKPLESGGKKIGSSTITVSTTFSHMSPSKHCHLSCRFERKSCLRTIQKLTSSSQQLVWIRRYEYGYIRVLRCSYCVWLILYLRLTIIIRTACRFTVILYASQRNEFLKGYDSCIQSLLWTGTDTENKICIKALSMYGLPR